MRFTTILFDLDGTLVDTLDDIADSANQALIDQSFPSHPNDAYKNFVGDGLVTLFERATPGGTNSAVIQECCLSFKHHYEENWRNKSCLYPGIRQTLNSLSKIGCKMAVLSNKPHEFTVQYVDYFFPENPFLACFGQRQTTPKKPDPTAVGEILQLLGSTPGESVFVGDSGVDMQTGKNSGLRSVGVSWGFRKVEELIDQGADLIIHHPMELVEHAGNI